MKKIIFIVFALYASFFAHSQTTNKNYIEVTGEVVYEEKPGNYVANIVLAQDLCYDYNNEHKTLQELEDEFFKKIKEAGIDKTKLIENKLGFSLSSYRKKGTFYKFTTTSKDEFQKLINIKSNGLQFQSKKVMYKELSNSESQKLRKKAIESAQRKANEYANIINKKISEIVFIKDYNYSSAATSYYTADSKKTYRITVAYLIK